MKQAESSRLEIEQSYVEDGKQSQNTNSFLAESKQGSAVVVFSAWNTMIGSAVTTLPWAYQKSGLALGLAISLISCFVSYYTCMLTVELVEDNKEFSDILFKYFGKSLDFII